MAARHKAECRRGLQLVQRMLQVCSVMSDSTLVTCHCDSTLVTCHCDSTLVTCHCDRILVTCHCVGALVTCHFVGQLRSYASRLAGVTVTKYGFAMKSFCCHRQAGRSTRSPFSNSTGRHRNAQDRLWQQRKDDNLMFSVGAV